MHHIKSVSRPEKAGGDVPPGTLFRLDVLIAIFNLIARQKN